MPNWCHNNLIVSGPSEDVKRFVSAARGRRHTYNHFDDNKWDVFDDIRIRSIVSSPPPLSDRIDELSFHALYPIPDKVRCYPYDPGNAIEIAKITGEENVVCGYTWENSNWGVKWGACDSYSSYEEGSNVAHYDFDTPWGPACEWHSKVAEDWPTLCFTLNWEEPGVAQTGTIVWQDGCLFSEETNEIEWENEEE